MKYGCILLAIFSLSACSKDPSYVEITCASLKQGLLNNDATIVNNFFGPLLSMKYTSPNFNKLTDTISQSCDITVEYSCFNCVQTLPPQSEIGLTFLDNNGDSTIRIISFAAAADSSIKLLGIEQ
jgi:hypothetical protein